MAKPRKPRKSKAQQESFPKENERDLWQAFTTNIKPLDAKGRVPEIMPPIHKAPLSAPPKTAAHPAKSPGGKKLGAVPASAKPKPDVKPQTAQIAPKELRRIGKGRTSIDARIDLHGMRQNEAYTAMRIFLQRSIAKGHRLVLIITGKGKPTSDTEAFGPFVHEGTGSRGILRRKVPLWLEQPEFRSIVVSYTTAHIRHGGEGALYVQLRRSPTGSGS